MNYIGIQKPQSRADTYNTTQNIIPGQRKQLRNGNKSQLDLVRQITPPNRTAAHHSHHVTERIPTDCEETFRNMLTTVRSENELYNKSCIISIPI